MESSPSERLVFYFIPWQICSFEHYLDFYGKLSAMLQILHRDCVTKYPPLFIVIIIVIHMAE